MLAVAQEDFHLVRRIPFGFVDDLVRRKKKPNVRKVTIFILVILTEG